MPADCSGSAAAMPAAQHAATGARICITSASRTIGRNFCCRCISWPTRNKGYHHATSRSSHPDVGTGTMQLSDWYEQDDLHRLKGRLRIAARGARRTYYGTPRSPLGLGCVQTDRSAGGRGGQSLQAADVIASDRRMTGQKWVSRRGISLLDALSGLQAARMAAIRRGLPTMFITRVRL